MDISFGQEDLRFSEEVKDFLSDNLTPELKLAGQLMTSVFADFESAMAWQKILHDKKGWAAPHWPEKWGGPGWSVTQHYLYSKACAEAEAPLLLPMGIQMCGPVLIGKGTTAQQEHYLPRILSGEDFWCQGYSEPQSGSDLASLKCKAVSDGDDYIVNGTKIWTTYAHHANKIFCLVRTDSSGKPQQGITFLLIDMDTPGITVDPIISSTMEHEQNQVFFEDVRVPKSNIVGQENDGWTVAKYLLEFERGGSAYAPRLQVSLQKIRQMAQNTSTDNAASLLADPLFAAKLASVEVDVLALEYCEHRVTASLSHGQNPGAISSMLKIKGTELSQQVTELAVETIGYNALPFQIDGLNPRLHPELVTPREQVPIVSHYINTRAASIYGGSNEIQRNIIAKAVLGL